MRRIDQLCNNTSFNDADTLGLEVVLKQDVLVDVLAFEEHAAERTSSNLKIRSNT
jgi:hypothetical protein